MTVCTCTASTCITPAPPDVSAPTVLRQRFNRPVQDERRYERLLCLSSQGNFCAAVVEHAVEKVAVPTAFFAVRVATASMHPGKGATKRGADCQIGYDCEIVYSSLVRFVLAYAVVGQIDRKVMSVVDLNLLFV